MSQIRPRGRYYDAYKDTYPYSPGSGVLRPLDPETELAVWTFDGAISASPNYGSATTSGLVTYRQLPALSVSRNLVKDGGATRPDQSYWTLHANASIVTDGTSPTGGAVKL